MLVEAFGEELSLEDWSKRTGIGESSLWRRLKRMPAEVALTLPRQAHVDENAEPGGPRSISWVLLEWEDDPWARRFVAAHPGGADQQTIADAIGVTRQRLEQIESAAKRKLRRLGVELDELMGG